MDWELDGALLLDSFILEEELHTPQESCSLCRCQWSTQSCGWFGIHTEWRCGNVFPSKMRLREVRISSPEIVGVFLQMDMANFVSEWFVKFLLSHLSPRTVVIPKIKGTTQQGCSYCGLSKVQKMFCSVKPEVSIFRMFKFVTPISPKTFTGRLHRTGML